MREVTGVVDYKNDIRGYLSLLQDTVNRLDLEELSRAMNALTDVYEREGTIYVFGNGGSAATASHFVCDFNKGISEGKKKKFRMICLSDNTPTIMAIANDFSYDEIFRYQLENVLTKNDLVLAISGSGNSKNVINAVEYAKSVGTEVIGITGYDGGKLKMLADYSMHVGVDNMQIAEDVHMVFDHMIMHILRYNLQ